MFGDEVADGSCGEHHHADRNDNGENHHGEVISHACGGDDGVDGENDVDNCDLGEYGPEADDFGSFFDILMIIEFVMDFFGGFLDEEETADEQDQAFATDAEKAIVFGCMR